MAAVVVVLVVLDGVWVSIDYLIMVCIQHVRTGTMGRQLKIISFVPAHLKAAITSLSLTRSPSTGHVMGMAKAWHVRRARASSGNTQGMINGSINESMSEEKKKKKGGQN